MALPEFGSDTHSQLSVAEEQVLTLSEANKQVNDLFTEWLSGRYPEAKNLKDVQDIINGTYEHFNASEPWQPPTGAIIVSDLTGDRAACALLRDLYQREEELKND